MDALLILAGLLLMVASLIWLVSRAFAVSLFWGFGTLLPPGWLVFCFRFWSRARPCLLIAGVGLMVLIVGLTMLSQRDSDRLARLLSLRWGVQQAYVPGALHLGLTGEFNGMPFQPEMAELIDGVLSFSDGDDLSRRELRVHLGEQPQGAIVLDLLPEDEGELPVIELVWVDPDNPLPEARRITHGYTLHLSLAPGRPNRMAGNFHLTVPGELSTALSGELEVYTSRLRYVSDTEIDTRFNSRETIEWLIRRHLSRVARTQDIEFVRLPPLDVNRTRLDLDIDVRVAGEVQSASLVLEHDDETGWRISRDLRPLQPVIRPVVAEQPVEEVADEVEEPVVDRRENFSLRRLLANPGYYQYLQVRVRTERGGLAEGQFMGLSRDGRLLIRYKIGNGEASFSFSPADVTRIQLLEP